MVLNFNQSVKKLRADDCHYIDIWEGHGRIDENNIFQKINADNVEDCITQLTEFAADFPGNYTVIARKGATTPRKEGYSFKCKLSIETMQMIHIRIEQSQFAFAFIFSNTCCISEIFTIV